MKQKKIMVIIVIGIITVSSVYFYFNNKVDSSKQDILILKTTPVNVNFLYDSNFTSLVTDTQIQDNKTMIKLNNGLSFYDERSSIKSGDVIYGQFRVYEPICQILPFRSNDKEIINNSKYQISEVLDPRCEKGYHIIDVTNWFKLNQK